MGNQIARSLFGFICLFAATSLAAPRPPEPDIALQFDRQAFVAGEPFQVQISVSTEGQGEPKIYLPQFDGFQVLRKNVFRPSSGMSFSLSFGTGKGAQRIIQNSGTTRYDIVLMAPEAGKYTVGPVKVVLDGVTFHGKSYPIEVFDRGDASAAAAAPQQVASDQLTDEQLAGAQIDPDYFLHMIPSKTSCTVGEQIVLDVYLFTSVGNIRSNQFEREPGTEGFWVERFEDFDLRNHRNKQVVINGTLYEQALLKKLALFPLKSGKLTIAPPVFSFVVGGGGGLLGFAMGRGKEVKRVASPVTVDVAPLPESGRPNNFNEANIGKYSFLVSANATDVKVGEPVTVTVNVRGTGNIRSVVLPSFGEVTGFKTYAPETDVEVQARGGIVSGVSQSRTLFIPETPGKLTIPSLTFTYFDFTAMEYRTRSSDPITVEVAQGKKRAPAEAEASGNRNRSERSPGTISAPIERMNQNMRTIVDSVDVSKAGPPMFARPWYLALVFGVPSLFVIFLVAVRLRQRAEVNFNRGRSRRAEGNARKEIALLERDSSLSKAGSNERFYSRLHKIVVAFLGERLEENVVGDTMNQLSQRLVSRGVDEELARDVIAMLEGYEFARFAKSDGGDSGRQDDLNRCLEMISRVGRVSLTAKPEESGGNS